MTPNERFIMALYYAYGRNDAIQSVVEPLKFAEHYAALYDDFQRGESSYMPSVQDTFSTYRGSLAMR